MEAIKATFAFEDIEDMVEALFDESEETMNATITYSRDRTIRLTVVKFKNTHVRVYEMKESDALYHEIDQNYNAIIEYGNSGSDYWDRWNAMLHSVDSYKVVDEVFNP